jgi:hypothetical protein
MLSSLKSLKCWPRQNYECDIFILKFILDFGYAFKKAVISIDFSSFKLTLEIISYKIKVDNKKFLFCLIRINLLRYFSELDKNFNP